MRIRCRLLVLSLLAVVALLGASPACAQGKTLRVGFFPNITHAHALIAQNMAAEGKNWFAPYLPGVTIRWQSFNAGPSAMEALFANAVDMTYVGPNPVLNAFLRSKGGVAVVSGAVRGGAGLVVPKGSTLAAPEDFKGKGIATPQLGNTQDIACRYWLTQAGLKVTVAGGDVRVVPTPNPSIVQLFAADRVDAAWTVEPWLSRLEMEHGGRMVYAEPPETSLTTVLSVGKKFMGAEPELVAKFVDGHTALTAWIKQNPEEAQKRVAAELSRQMRREFPLALVVHAWPRLVYSDSISEKEFSFSYTAARSAGFLKGDADLSGLVVKP